MTAMDLFTRIESHTARVGVIGLGYVGLPLAVEFARAGFRVVGIDCDRERVAAVTRGCSYVGDVESSVLAGLVAEGLFTATEDPAVLSDLDTVNICVPTPLRKTKDPDITFILSAVGEVARHLHTGMLVILESTTYPGTTEEVVQPALERSGLRAGADFCLAFSPERVDPGNARYQTRNIPKVVGGVTPQCTEAAAALYRQCIEHVVPVSSPRVAEMVKLLENTFRSVNIALANELALMCRTLGIDVWEVIDGAASKPFGFMPFYPGPGLGGHCIPVDPHYLSWKARENGFEPRFIDLAGSINARMPEHVVGLVADGLNRHRLSVSGSRVHVLGVSYKRGVADIRESPALEVMRLLWERGALLSYSDPRVPELRGEGLDLRAIELRDAMSNGIDCAVVLTDHPEFDYEGLAAQAPLIIDTRNALRGCGAANVIRL